MQKILYSEKKKALIFIDENATPDYWDDQWNTDHLKKEMTGTRTSKYWHELAMNYLPEHAVILEGGCGIGHLVDALNFWGYKAIGIDFAEKTVAMVKSIQPDMNILYGDVRRLPFGDNTFDGYFSLGVIEHFWEGYGPILNEMKRVIKPGGYLFLSVPCISRMDAFFLLLNRYAVYDRDEMPDDFYQYALDIRSVKHTFENEGFVHKKFMRRSGLFGISHIHPAVGSWFNYLRSRIPFKKALSRGLSFFLSPLTSHSVMFVFQKQVE
ncbi:MAG: methyltransferase domain-containing protein [Anaerohalosphaeraceae bacterium]